LAAPSPTPTTGHDRDLTEEARSKWGDSPAWKESQRRTAAWGKEDWVGVKAELEALVNRMAAGMGRGADDAAVQAAVREYHEFIDSRFYTCPATTFLGLSDLWGEDERFRAFWEGHRPGLTDFVREAVHIYVEELLLANERIQ
jgi:hypothetical protein